MATLDREQEQRAIRRLFLQVFASTDFMSYARTQRALVAALTKR